MSELLEALRAWLASHDVRRGESLAVRWVDDPPLEVGARRRVRVRVQERRGDDDVLLELDDRSRASAGRIIVRTVRAVRTAGTWVFEIVHEEIYEQ